MTHVLRAAACIACAPLLIFAAGQNAPQQPAAPQNRMAMMTQRMDDALRNCQQAQTALTEGLGLVNQARNNPGSYTQSSLTDAARKLTEAQSAMGKCTATMGQMRQMHEQMRSRMQQSGAASTAPPK